MEFSIVDNDNGGKAILLKERNHLEYYSHSMWLKQNFRQPHTVSNNTTLKVRFKFSSSFAPSIPNINDSPLKIFLKIGGSWVQIAALNSLVYTSDQWHEFTLILVNSDIGTISVGNLIEGIMLQVQGY